jgi:hypothetical protein
MRTTRPFAARTRRLLLVAVVIAATWASFTLQAQTASASTIYCLNTQGLFVVCTPETTPATTPSTAPATVTIPSTVAPSSLPGTSSTSPGVAAGHSGSAKPASSAVILASTGVHVVHTLRQLGQIVLGAIGMLVVAGVVYWRFGVVQSTRGKGRVSAGR